MSDNVHQTTTRINTYSHLHCTLHTRGGNKKQYLPPWTSVKYDSFSKHKKAKYAFLKALRKSYDQYENSITRKFEIDM
jgi:hypothetical protein